MDIPNQDQILDFVSKWLILEESEQEYNMNGFHSNRMSLAALWRDGPLELELEGVRLCHMTEI